MNKPATTKAQLKRAFAVAAELGMPVAGLRVRPDGITELMFGEALTPAPPAPPVAPGSWEEYDRDHGHG